MQCKVISTVKAFTSRIQRSHLIKLEYYYTLGTLQQKRFIMEEVTSKAETLTAEKSHKSAETKLSKRAQKKLLAKEKERKRKEAKRMQHQEDSMTNNSDILKDFDMKETEYYFEKGLRKVYPYYYEFSTYAKGRWVGRTLVDVFTEEFKYTTVPVVEAISNGLVTVNGERTSVDYKLKDHDYIRNKIHRHELPVVHEDIEIIADTDQVLVINKPSSIPVHPCGRYHYNSLPYILAKDTGYKNLRSIYRLDRLTSGVVIFCKVEGLARTMIQHIKQRKVQKEYICRVDGEFPSGVVECQEPLDVFSPKAGIQIVTKSGKSAHTTFERMSYNGHSSVVKCMPHTGRTHQIRVHLQFLGHPIVNDPLYNHEVWGPCKGKGGQFGKSDSQLLEDLLKAHADDRYVIKPGEEARTTTQESELDTPVKSITTQSKTEDFNKCECTECDSSEREHRTDNVQSESLVFSEHVCCQITSGDRQVEEVINSHKRPTSDCESERECKIQKCDNSERRATGLNTRTDTSENFATGNSMEASGSEVDRSNLCPGFDPAKMTFDKSCITCQQKFRDPHRRELFMFLHAYSYQGPGWRYTTSLPEWAKETWLDSH